VGSNPTLSAKLRPRKRAFAFGGGAGSGRSGEESDQWFRSPPASPYVTFDQTRGSCGEPAGAARRPERAGIRRIRRPAAIVRWHDDVDRGAGHEAAMGQQARTDEDFEPLSTDGLEVVEARDERPRVIMRA